MFAVTFRTQSSDIINQSISQQQQIYLRKILNQTQLNIGKYQQFIPEGERLLAPLINNLTNN
ncbi:MAG: hypothetical protein AAF383_19080 [Cyanobacteria bacterium P01_A01_bin.83]